MLLSRQDRKEAAEGISYVAIGIVVAILLIGGAGTLWWWLGVATSGAKGRGDVIKQNNNATNQIAAQNEFNRLWGDIQGYHSNIAITAAALAKNPADTDQQSTLIAEQQICNSAVQTYNADTNDTTMNDWRPANDPATIDPATECETAP